MQKLDCQVILSLGRFAQTVTKKVEFISSLFSYHKFLLETVFLKRPSLIRLAQKEKYRVRFSVGINNIVSRHFEYYKYLSTYSVGIKYIVSRH